jgi:hypothetical protein
VVPMTFGRPWLRHSNHPERAVVLTDVVRVSEPAACTLGLSVRVFTPLPAWENPKPWFWHFELWFPKVLEISENTLLYITAGSFGNGGGGGEGKVFKSASGAVGEGCDPTVIPTLRTTAMLCGNGSYTETVVVQPPSQTDTGRPLLHRPLPPPPPQNPHQIDRQTDREM